MTTINYTTALELTEFNAKNCRSTFSASCFIAHTSRRLIQPMTVSNYINKALVSLLVRKTQKENNGNVILASGDFNRLTVGNIISFLDKDRLMNGHLDLTNNAA